jgi:hypothetical protein
MAKLRFMFENNLQTIENREGVLWFPYVWDSSNKILRKYLFLESSLFRKIAIKNLKKKTK